MICAKLLIGAASPRPNKVGKNQCSGRNYQTGFPIAPDLYGLSVLNSLVPKAHRTTSGDRPGRGPRSVRPVALSAATPFLASESQASCPFLPQTFRLEHRSAPPNWPPTPRPSIGPAPAAGCPALDVAATATAVWSACFIHSGKLRPVRFYSSGAGGAPLSNPSPNAPAGAEISRLLNQFGNYLQNAEAGVFRHE